MNRRVLFLMALFTALALLIAAVSYALADNTLYPYSLTAGTKYRSTYRSDTLGTDVRLDQPIDTFDTNPFSSSPTRFYPAAANVYGSGTLDFDPIGGSTELIYGATKCFDTDNGVNCATGQQAIPQILNPPFATFSVAVEAYTRFGAGNFGVAYYGLAHCPDFNAACTSNDLHADGKETFDGSLAIVRDFVGVQVVFPADGADCGLQINALVKYSDGTAASNSSNLCIFPKLTWGNISGTYSRNSAALNVTLTNGTATQFLSLPTNNSKSVYLNSMAWTYVNAAGTHPGIRMDNATMTYRANGTWETAAQMITQNIQSPGTFTADNPDGGATRTLGPVVFKNGTGSTIATSATVSGSTPYTYTNSSFVNGVTIAANITLTGDRVSSPRVSSAGLLLNLTSIGSFTIDQVFSWFWIFAFIAILVLMLQGAWWIKSKRGD